jgi:hypothetical protein
MYSILCEMITIGMNVLVGLDQWYSEKQLLFPFLDKEKSSCPLF